MNHMIGGPLILPRITLAGSSVKIRPDALLWLDDANNVVKPASALTWDTSEAITARNFASRFAGTAAGGVIATDPAGTRPVIHQGEVEFQCSAAAFKAGTLLRAKKDAGANLLDDFIVVATSDPRDAIAVVSRDHPSGSTRVRAFILSRHVLGMAGFNPGALVKSVSWHFTDVGTGGDALSDWTFGERIALLSAHFVQHTVQASADKVFTFKNGATSLTPTMTVAASGSAVGKVTSIAFDPTVAANQFEHDDLLDIADDGGGTGAGTMVLRYCLLPGSVQ